MLVEREGLFSRVGFHPWLLGVWPVLWLYGENVEEVRLGTLTFPLVLSLAGASVLWAVFWLFLREGRRAALGASVLLVAFSVLWKPVTQNLLAVPLDLPGWRPAIPMSAYSIAAVALAVVAARRAKSLGGPTRFCNAGVLFLVSVTLAQIGWTARAENSFGGGRFEAGVALSPSNLRAGDGPDVYFIVLDGYSRHDLLLEFFGVDNGPFLKGMAARGFVEVSLSESDYTTTALSLSSCLNMDYFDQLVEQDGEGGSVYRPFWAYLRNNAVQRTFRGMGYGICGFTTGYGLTEPGTDMDVLFRPGLLDFTGGEFEDHWLGLTPFTELVQWVGLDTRGGRWRRRVLYTLDRLTEPARVWEKGPVFVRAHVISPHRPFVFDAEGEPYDSGEAFGLRQETLTNAARDRRDYGAQVQGLNRHVEAAIDRVLAQSEQPPVIALVSDHGPVLELTEGRRGDGVKNLCLLYLPGVPADRIPQDLRLVNLFRFIFREVYGADVALLERRPAGEGPKG